MTDLKNIVLGVLIGIAANFLWWWTIFHGFSPRLYFSPSICKTARKRTPRDKSKYVYRVKLENSGKRGIIDAEFMARLHLRGLKGYPKGLNQIVYVPLGSNGEIVHKIPYVPPVRKSHSRPILIFFTEAQGEFKNPNNYPAQIVRRAKSKSLHLEDVLALGSDSSLQVIGFGYDEFSGSRKIFRSKKYTIQDVRLGIFRRNGLDVIDQTEKPKNGSAGSSIRRARKKRPNTA